MVHLHHRRKSNSSKFTTKSARERKTFDRETELPKLIGLWPSELRDYSIDGTVRIVALLSKALRSERRRGNSGHWAYDLNRHMALAEALKEEEVRLASLKAALQSDRGCATMLRRPGASGAKPSAGGLAGMGASAQLVGDAHRQGNIVAEHLVDGASVIR